MQYDLRQLDWIIRINLFGEETQFISTHAHTHSYASTHHARWDQLLFYIVAPHILFNLRIHNAICTQNKRNLITRDQMICWLIIGRWIWTRISVSLITVAILVDPYGTLSTSAPSSL